MVVCSYGRERLTRRVVADVGRERPLARTVVVDNGTRGGYRPSAGEDVVTPGRNLGWLAGSNLGVTWASRLEPDAYLLLNNDVRLSTGFVAAMVGAWRATGAWLLGPCYDDAWPRQRVRRPGPARHYRPVDRHRQVPFVDGTAIFLPAATVAEVGLFDEAAFGLYGWGADIDLALRVRAGGGQVVVTETAFLNHRRGATAGSRGLRRHVYREHANAEMVDALDRKWGTDWRRLTGVDDAVTRANPPPSLAQRLAERLTPRR